MKAIEDVNDLKIRELSGKSHPFVMTMTMMTTVIELMIWK
jgi:hypothetical protein